MTKSPVPAHVSPDRVYEFDMYWDPRLMADLHGGFEEVIRDAPAPFWTPLNGGHWVITKYAQCEEVCRDYAHFSTTENQIPRVKHPQVFIPLHYDPPKATPFRQALLPAFTPKAVAPLEDKMRAWTGKFIDLVLAQGHCDFVTDVSARFPVTIFMEMMGIPLANFDRFRQLAEDFFTEHPEEEHYAINDAIYAEMDQLIDARIANPTGDLVSTLIEAKIDGRPITRDELRSMCFLLFLAGLDTVVNVMSFTFRQLAGMPDMQARLRADPSAIPGFVEEGLRLFGVVNVPRIVMQDCERFGVKFRKGDMVLALISQVGREAKENPDPLKIDPDRKDRKLMPFSTGPHLCPGHHLARVEMRILIEEWLKRIPSFRVAADYKPEYRAGMVMALKSLPLEWDVQTAAKTKSTAKAA
jgi:cytochrome P450